MMNNLKEIAVSVQAAEHMSPEQMQGKVLTGVLYRDNRPEYVEEYQKVIEAAQDFAG